MKMLEELNERLSLIEETWERIEEKLITFGNKRPKYGTAVVLAGGAGSGKGFILDKLIGIEGKVFDVDKFKTDAIKKGFMRDRILKDHEVDVFDLDLKDPKNVSRLHDLLSGYNLKEKTRKMFIDSINNVLPNVIFDITMKDLSDLTSITDSLLDAGYDIKNIHVVWVVNDIDTALAQNLARDRVVDPNLVKDIHDAVSRSISKIVRNIPIRNYMDGDFWFVFNKAFVDVTLKFSKIGHAPLQNRVFKNRAGGGNVVANAQVAKKLGKEFKDDAIYFKVKEQGKSMMKFDDIPKKFIDKIKDYVPNPKEWE